MLALLAAAITTPAPCSLSASLTKTAAPSGGIVTSDAVTVNVPPGNSGVLKFTSFIITGAVATEYRKNVAAWALATDGGSETFAQGDTLAVRITGASAGDEWAFTLRDDTRSVSVVGSPFTITAI